MRSPVSTGAATDSVTDVRGVRVGHANDPHRTTGTTVLRFDQACPTVVQVLGGASATYDIGSLALDATFGRRWAIFFSGGSLFGLDAGRGVRTALLDSGAGHRVFRNPRRIAPVSGATLFDLPRSEASLPDYAELGAEACRRARRDERAMGAVGAGTGATVGKYRGRELASPGGIGSASRSVAGLGRIAALVAVNAVGAIRDPRSGRWVAGARGPKGRILPPDPSHWGRVAAASGTTGTTLVAVVTDQPFTRGELFRLATLASAGLAVSVVPAFSATDGDVLFAATTGESGRRAPERYPGAAVDRLGLAAAEVVATSVVRAIVAARA
jgi:L-aminopeptidase/D-esterase-like protein